MVENDEIAILKIETVQFVASAFRIHDIFVDDESGTLGIGSDALTDLSVENIRVSARALR